MIPNTLSSGLDDYPRSTVPTQDEYHVDLHAWMTKSAQIMSRVQTVLLERNASTSADLEAAMAFDYTQLASVLQHSLDELHWSDLHRGYFDVGYNNESSFFLVEMFFRCSSTGAYSMILLLTTAIAITMGSGLSCRFRIYSESRASRLHRGCCCAGRLRAVRQTILSSKPSECSVSPRRWNGELQAAGKVRRVVVSLLLFVCMFC